VLKKGVNVPAAMKDGVLLAPEVDVAERVRDFAKQSDVEGFLRLESVGSLLRGVFGCDGITLFTSDGKLLGYNIFVRLAAQAEDQPARGGARRRAFAILEALIESGELAAAFYRSQDGDAHCKRARK
jgi:hypothetical protein